MIDGPIGILDSGVGGLSVLREIRRELPTRDLIYIGDSAWCPYGNKSAEQIRERVFTLVDDLIERDCRLVVIACNSATIAAVEALRSTYPIPFVGMEPGVKPAAAQTKSGVIGVLATEASLAGEKFHNLITRFGQGVRVITRPCPEFVEHVEAGRLEGPEVEASIHRYTDDLLEEGADVLVLGCTHYPFLKDTITKVVGPKISLIDTGPSVARRVAEVAGALSTSADHLPTLQLFTTGEHSRIDSLTRALLADIADVEVNPWTQITTL